MLNLREIPPGCLFVVLLGIVRGYSIQLMIAQLPCGSSLVFFPKKGLKMIGPKDLAMTTYKYEILS